MRSKTERWPVSRLLADANLIKFPDYQREPTVWSRDAKQRLIDSISRGFDIASVYFYANDDGSWDCVDGRQRIGAIMAFLCASPESEHNGFEFKVLNEVLRTRPLTDSIASTGDPTLRSGKLLNDTTMGRLRPFSGSSLTMK